MRPKTETTIPLPPSIHVIEASRANPYSPPESVSGLCLDENGYWRIEGLDLWVRDGAEFTDVDLANGEVYPERPVQQAVQLEGLLTRWITWGTMGVGFGGAEIYKAISGARFTSALVFIPLLLIIPLITKRLPKANVAFVLANWRVRRLLFVKRLGAISAGFGGLFGLGLLFLSKGDQVELGVSIVVLGFLVGGIASVFCYLWSPRLRCIGNQGSWFRITGVALQVIEHLSRQVEQEENVRGASPAPADAFVPPESSGA